MAAIQGGNGKMGVGIVGTGGIANAHAMSIKGNPDTEIVGFAEIREGVAEAFGKRHGVDVHIFDDYRELVKMDGDGLRKFARMTGDLIIAMLECPQVIIAAIDGVCVGAGAAIAMAADMRFGTAQSKTAFLFTRVGLAGCDMGACAMLPRIIGQGRASELLFTGRSMSGEEAFGWGFFNRLCEPETVQSEAIGMAKRLADGPNFAHAITKNQLNIEWDMPLDTAIEAEAQAQAICMQTEDFKRAYRAFVARERPKFEGN